jgi:hypothetical protein
MPADHESCDQQNLPRPETSGDTLAAFAAGDISKPAYGRSPAPGTQQEAGASVAAWVKTGAACPEK